MKEIRRINPDILHLITLKPHLYGVLAARILGVRKLVMAVAGFGNLANTHSRRFGMNHVLLFIYRVLVRRQDYRFIVQNYADLDLLESRLNIRPDDVLITLGSGVDLSAFRPAEKRVNGSKRVLFAGRLLKSKGLNEFIQIASELSYLDVEFCVAGKIDANNPDSFTQLEIEELGFRAPNVKFLGHVDMPACLREVGMILYPSTYGEGVPKVLLESAASGLPIVTTNTPGCGRAVEDGVTGYLCASGDAQMMAERTRRLLTDPALYERMSIAARAMAEKEFGVAKVVNAHLKLYQQLAS